MNYNKLNQLVANLNAVIGSQETKTAKKLLKIYEKVKSHHETYQAEVETLRLDNAAVGEKDILLLDDKGSYKFTKEGIKNLTKQVEELGNKEFEFKRSISYLRCAFSLEFWYFVAKVFLLILVRLDSAANYFR
jgi:hypothetical protein